MDAPAASFGTPSALRNAAIQLLSDQYTNARNPQNQNPVEAADNLLFVVPEGVGRPFVAVAGTNHWMSTFSSRWVGDLRALSHELGKSFILTSQRLKEAKVPDHG